MGRRSLPVKGPAPPHGGPPGAAVSAPALCGASPSSSFRGGQDGRRPEAEVSPDDVACPLGCLKRESGIATHPRNAGGAIPPLAERDETARVVAASRDEDCSDEL